MSAQRTSFEKLQRDRAKKAKAAAKREKRQERDAASGTDTDTGTDLDRAAGISVSDYGEELSASDLLELVEALHQQFEAKLISYEEFEEQKAELLGRLPIE